MLEGLDSIDWARIQHSHGTAEEFPRWLRELRSEDAGVREAARNNLFEYSNHQQSIYPVSACLVPFLIELAAAPDTPERWYLLHQLADLAASSEGARSNGEYGSDEDATYTNVAAGFDLYVRLLADPDPAVRADAAYAVSVLDRAQGFWPILDHLLDTTLRETDALALSMMIHLIQLYLHNNESMRAMDILGDRLERLHHFLAQQIATGGTPMLRLRAARAYLTLAGKDRAAIATARALLDAAVAGRG